MAGAHKPLSASWIDGRKHGRVGDWWARGWMRGWVGMGSSFWLLLGRQYGGMLVTVRGLHYQFHFLPV